MCATLPFCQAILSAALALGAWFSGQPAAAQSSCRLVEDGFGPAGSVAVRAETVVSGLEVPWGLAFQPSGEILVTERPGRVRLIRNGALVEKPVLTLEVVDRGEGGLLGIALHPEFKSNRLFYLYSTVQKDEGAANRIERYRLSPDGVSATFERMIVDDLPAGSVHDGGRLRFGPDGMLYASVGETRNPELAQDPASRGGKILRIAPDGGSVSVFLSGVRNSQGFDWINNDVMAVSDHGPSGELGRSGHDELNFARSGDNLGWPTTYGCEERAGLVTPALVWKEALPPGGLAVYRGTRIPQWTGSVLIGSLGSTHLQRIAIDPRGPSVVSNEVYFDGLGRIRDVIDGPDGALYVTTSNCDGRGDCGSQKDSVLRIVPR